MSNSGWAALSRLLGESSVDQFLSNYWESRYCHISGVSSPDKKELYRSLFSFDLADQILSIPGPRFSDFIRMSKGGQMIPSSEYSAPRQDGLVDFNVDRILELYDDNATITLNRAHQSSPPLGEFCAQISKELRSHVNANVYITPPNAQGFPAHSDNHDVFLLQADGKKNWRIQSHLEYLATPRNRNVISDPLTAAWDELRLDFGDALYIPRGLLHEGISEDSHSLHITLGIHPYTMADLLRDLIAEVEARDGSFRKSVSASALPFVDLLSVAKSTLSAELSNASLVGEMISRRTSRYETGSYRGRFRKLTEPGRLSLTTEVRMRRGLQVRLARDNEDVCLCVGTKSLRLPLFVADHLEMVLKSSPISAQQLPSDLDDEGKLTLLRRLLAEGVIELC